MKRTAHGAIIFGKKLYDPVYWEMFKHLILKAEAEALRRKLRRAHDNRRRK